MSGTVITILLLSGLALFILSIAVRSKTGSRYEIKGIDLALVLVPFLAWLLVTGRIERIAIGGVEVEVAETFLTASSAPIESQVTRASPLTIDDVVETVELATKGGVDRIPRLIESKTEALEFTLKHGGYWGPAIREYFESLTAYAFLRYAIIHQQDGTLFGVFDARDLVRYFREQGLRTYDDFARHLNAGDTRSLQHLKDLPGFLPGEYAVTPNENKRSVLEQMEKRNSETLPVVDSQRRFVGMVERTRLTASLIIEVAQKLEGLGNALN